MGMERDMTDRDVAAGPALMRSGHFAIRASTEACSRLWEPVPRPGYHDLLAMTRFAIARIEGDLQPPTADLRYVREALETPHGRTGGHGHDA